MDINRFQMHDYAEKYFTVHKGRRRFWRRKRVDLSVSLHWSTDVHVLLRYGTSKTQMAIRKSAERVAKLVLTFMGDRFYKGENRDRLALELIELCVAVAGVRDELYCQLVKQTTENPNRVSLLRGWELFVIASAFVPPTRDLHSYLIGYVGSAVQCVDDSSAAGSSSAQKQPASWESRSRAQSVVTSDPRDPASLDFPLTHPDTGENLNAPSVARYARFALRRLQKLSKATRQEFLGKLHSPKLHEIRITRALPLSDHVPVFGSSLEELMHTQKMVHPVELLPLPLTSLCSAILKADGAQQEGIFRVAPSTEKVADLKRVLERADYPALHSSDAHVPATLLKLWLAQLEEPLITAEVYSESIENSRDGASLQAFYRKGLIEIHYRVLLYLIEFLRVFLIPENNQRNLMTARNLAICFAPVLFRCPHNDSATVLANSRSEVQCTETMLLHFQLDR